MVVKKFNFNSTKVSRSIILAALLLQNSSVCLAANAPGGAGESSEEAITSPESTASALPAPSQQGISEISAVAAASPSVVLPVPASAASPADAKGPSDDQPAATKAQDPDTAPTGAAKLQGGVSIEPSAARGQVEDLTRQILLKEIELERFNIHYSMEVAKQGRWKGWRYAGFQEANASLGLAGAIISVHERGEHIDSPHFVNIQVQESANTIPMIGSIIGAAAAALEFSINEYHDLQARRHGFSPSAARAHVQGLKQSINDLLTQREALTRVEASTPALAACAEVDTVEGRVLADLRNQGLLEYERFHIGARKLFAFQQAQYLFDVSRYTLNAIGYRYAYLSLAKHHRLYNGTAGVMWDIAGPLYIAGPIVSRVIAKGVGEIHRHYLRPTTQDAESAQVETLVQDHAALDKLCSLHPGSDASTTALNRSAMYGLNEKSFQDEYVSGKKANAKAKLSATQNVTAGVLVGGCKLAQGILFTIPGFNHNYNVHNFRSDRTTNSDLFVGSLLNVPAGMYSILDTLRIQVRGEINRHKLIAAGLHPSQLAHSRLAALDDMESKLKAPSANTK